MFSPADSLVPGERSITYPIQTKGTSKANRRLVTLNRARTAIIRRILQSTILEQPCYSPRAGFLPESKDLLCVPQPAASEQGGVVLLQTVTATPVSAKKNRCTFAQSLDLSCCFAMDCRTSVCSFADFQRRAGILGG